MNIALIGMGKMGREILSLLDQYQFTAVFTADSTTSLIDAPWKTIDVCIDFSQPTKLLDRMEIICFHKKPLVLGTTGWDSQRNEVLAMFQASNTSLVWGSNFSPGMFIFHQIVRSSAHLLEGFPDFDVALFEAHHNKKQDAPSGTLLSLQEEFPNKKESAALRVGSVPGTHMVWIDGPEESITLTHAVRNRRTFAHGSLRAAQLLQQHPGIWHIYDLFRRSL